MPLRAGCAILTPTSAALTLLLGTNALLLQYDAGVNCRLPEQWTILHYYEHSLFSLSILI